MSEPVFTIGHSNLPLDPFLGLLAQHRIEALADIRRFPSSKTFPHFNQKTLAAALKEAGIEYHWLGSLGRSPTQEERRLGVSQRRPPE